MVLHAGSESCGSSAGPAAADRAGRGLAEAAALLAGFDWALSAGMTMIDPFHG
ncbi:hypothetical protein [Streptomyces goshikiensis]|uniref:hypothetical protein n=1 Tax=Streptomyces goshikiensis TaxID=1942 RepID=UPI003D9F1AD7